MVLACGEPQTQGLLACRVVSNMVGTPKFMFSDDSRDYKEFIFDILKPPALCQNDFEKCHHDWRKDWCSNQ